MVCIAVTPYEGIVKKTRYYPVKGVFLMAYKLYKRKYTSDDIKVVESYIRSNATDLFIEVWENNSEDGTVHSIKVNGLSQAIYMASKIYDNFNAKK